MHFAYIGPETNKHVKMYCIYLFMMYNFLSLSSSLSPPHRCQMLSHPRRCGLGGGYHAGECGQGFGKGPEAFRAG